MRQNKWYDDMIHRVTCDKCGSISEYVDRYIWEGWEGRKNALCVEILLGALLQKLYL